MWQSSSLMMVLQHFGFEAPALLNKYSCVLEDVLIDTLGLRPQEEEVKETPPTKKARRFKKKRQM